MKKSVEISFLVIVLGLFFSTAFAQNPSFYISNGGSSYNVLEGNVYTFTVNLYSVSATPVVVNVNTSIGTAGNTDFTTLSTTVTILAGQLSSSSLTISTVNDAIIESYYESFTITGTVISSNTFNTTDVSYINIIDNDTTPTVTINDRTIVEGQGANMTINLSNPFSSNVNINYLTATGTANASDFTSISNSITIPAGQTSYSFYVYTTSDASTEPDENFGTMRPPEMLFELRTRNLS